MWVVGYSVEESFIGFVTEAGEGRHNNKRPNYTVSAESLPHRSRSKSCESTCEALPNQLSANIAINHTADICYLLTNYEGRIQPLPWQKIIQSTGQRQQ